MKRFFSAVGRFFTPSSDSKLILRIAPFAVVAVIMIAIFVGGNFVWEETNSSTFCGLTCHTMPPEYITYQHSAHTNVSCEDCHMGRDRLHVLMPRKIEYSWQTGSAMLLNNYEYPIVARNMRPARDACENCHKPEVFSADKLVEVKNFAENENNSLSSIFLVMKIGGGTQRQGLGYGIHWHVENPVDFYATDDRSQNIPYVRVTNPDGSITEYIDVDADFDPASIDPDQLQRMDCITCHNRTAHLITSPEETMDELLGRGLVSADIPNIKVNGIKVLENGYTTEDEAMQGIAALVEKYQDLYPDYTVANGNRIEQAVQAIQEAYLRTHFPDQEVDWQTHPNNITHFESPGCFRCHDGSHLSAEEEAIRLECNLCHSIPLVTTPDQIEASLQLNKGFEPASHQNSNWIALHRTVFDESCQSCHTVEDPGGVSNTSFCSNSACHSSVLDYAGLDAPNLRAILGEQALQYLPTQTPATSQPTPAPGGVVTFANVSELMTQRCGSCHGTNSMAGLSLTSYEGVMAGSENGDVVIPGDPENSPLVQIQTGPQNHFGQFSDEELELIIQWIEDGALE